MKISEVISKLCKFHPPVDENRTCDVVKIGNPEQECTGIVVTTYATIEVIKEAVALKANMIIVHEPLFYQDRDSTDWLEGNSVYEEKSRLLEENNIVVWRDHDHIHGGPPSAKRTHTDLIFYGIMKTLGWERYLIGDEKKPLVYEIPETTLRELSNEVITKLNLNGARIIGDLDAKVHRIFICEHVNGSNFGGHDHDSDCITKVENEGYDVMMPLEIIDWTLSEYVRDAVSLGKTKALIEIGHFNLEEAGMKYMAQWLPGVLDDDTPVHFVQSGDAFQYVTK
jgi:hypothetical protein